MKVLQINAVNKIGSTGRNAFELNEFLSDNGHTYLMAYSKGPSVNPLNEYIIGNSFDTKLHAVFSRITGKQGYFSKRATKALLKKTDDYQPDVVVLNNLHGNYINLPLLLTYLAKKKIPTVVVLHDCWFFTGKCCHYAAKGCYKWQNHCGKCPQLKKYNKSWFFDRTQKMLEDKKRLFDNIPNLAVVGVSDWILNEAKKAPVFENVKLFKRIYNWIDIDLFVPVNADSVKEKLGLTGKKIILAVASGWNVEKGIQKLVELSNKLNEDERLLVIGNINTDVQMNDKVINIPTTSSIAELVEYYSSADVFVQPSLEETFGKVTAEALACGVPCVCFNSTANPELIGEGCGYVVDGGNVEEMCAKIRHIFKEGKENYSDKCRNFAELYFEKQKNIEQYMTFLKELMEI